MAPRIPLSAFKAALITGGSSGIGAAFIRTVGRLEELLWIGNISRREPEQFSADSRFQHFPCDLSDASGLVVTADSVVAALRAVEPGPILLINNSGFGSYGPFDQLDPAHETNMIDLNVRAVVDLTARLLPLLRERGGAIVNVASVAGWQPTPYMATYGATKAFVLHWSLSLREDLRESGIGVLAVCPGPTESNFFRRAGFGEAPMPGQGQTAEEVVAESLRALERGRPFVVTGWRNRLLTVFACRLPRRWQGPIARVVLRRMRLDRMQSARHQ